MNPVNHLRQFSLGVLPCGNGWKLSCGQKSVRYLTKLDYIQPDWRVGIINPSIFIRDSDKSFFWFPLWMTAIHILYVLMNIFLYKKYTPCGCGRRDCRCFPSGFNHQRSLYGGCLTHRWPPNHPFLDGFSMKFYHPASLGYPPMTLETSSAKSAVVATPLVDD